MAFPIVYVIPKTRKGIKITMAVVGSLFLIGAIVVFFLWSADQRTLKQNGQADFNTLSQEELIDGMFVTGDIDVAIDHYAEEFQTGYFNTRVSDKSDALYYLLPIYNTDGAISYFITYEAEPKDFDTMEQVVTQSWSEDPLTARLTVKNAEIHKLPSDLQQYLTEWISDSSFYENGSFIDWCAETNVTGTQDRDAITSKFMPFIIRQKATAGTDLTTAWLFLGFSIMCFAIMLIMIFVKAPIKGVEETPLKEDFSKLREMEAQSHNERSDF